MTISWIKNKTDILDQETLEGIQSRFYDFCEANKIEKIEESWNKFWFPVNYFDFLELSGNKIIDDEGNEVIFNKPGYSTYAEDKKKFGVFGADECYVNDDQRFNCGWHRDSEVKYPVDTDLRIRIFLKGKHTNQFAYASYNELRGYANSGRNGHWSEYFTFKNKAPCNTYFANKNIMNNWISDPLYRKTPNGQSTVEDLIKPGTIVKTNYGNTEYIVKSVIKCMYKPIERPADHIFEHYSLTFIDRKTNKGGFCVNELVAVDGRILKLFMTNEDEVFILGNVDEVPIEIKDEYDDEDYDGCCDSSCFIGDEPNIVCDSNDTDDAIPAIPNQVETVTQLTFDF